MKIILVGEDVVRVEAVPGPLTIEAPSAEAAYSPFHMLGSALGVCTYSVLASWGTTVGIDTGGLALDVSWTFAERPHRIGSVRLAFDWPKLPAERVETAKRVAALCPIHATLNPTAPVTVEVHAGAPPPAEAAR